MLSNDIELADNLGFENNSEARPAASAAAQPAIGPKRRKRDRLSGTVVSAATKLLPLVELLERIRPHVENDSVFSSRRDKIRAQMVLVQEQLKSDQPKRQALVEAFKTMSEFVLEESKEVSKDEVKESTKRFVMATIKNAPSLISAAQQAGLLS